MACYVLAQRSPLTLLYPGPLIPRPGPVFALTHLPCPSPKRIPTHLHLRLPPCCRRQLLSNPIRRLKRWRLRPSPPPRRPGTPSAPCYSPRQGVHRHCHRPHWWRCARRRSGCGVPLPVPHHPQRPLLLCPYLRYRRPSPPKPPGCSHAAAASAGHDRALAPARQRRVGMSCERLLTRWSSLKSSRTDELVFFSGTKMREGGSPPGLQGTLRLASAGGLLRQLVIGRGA